MTEFKFNFTCSDCGENIKSDVEGATTCKKCIAEQAIEEQHKADVAFLTGERQHRHETCERCNFEISCAVNEVMPNWETCKYILNTN